MFRAGVNVRLGGEKEEMAWCFVVEQLFFLKGRLLPDLFEDVLSRHHYMPFLLLLSLPCYLFSLLCDMCSRDEI